MSDIKKLRGKIDTIDAEILKLLLRRGDIAKKIGGVKKESDADFYVPSREKEILLKIKNKDISPFTPESIESIFREILNASRSVERKIRVAYLGPAATFTHQAAIKNFGVNADFIPAESISDVFAEVERKRADYGVVPVENTSEGIVTHTLDMFFNSDMKIVSEINLQIEHCLLSKSKWTGSVKAIYSHPQAFAQTRKWIHKNCPTAKLKETLSTAMAAAIARNEKNSAAIASAVAAKLYSLNIIASGIEDIKENFTRFLIIGHNISESSKNDKTSVMISLKDRVGALHDMLIPFKKNKINLTKIESRPTKRKAWEYVFFIDFLGHISDENVKAALGEVEKNSNFIKILGSYPKAE